MGCSKTLTISGASAGQSPLLDAAYVPAPINKIFGTSGPYVIKCNAATGTMESFTRIYSPMYGDNRICYHAGTGMLFVSGHNEVNRQNFSLTHPGRDIFRVNPSTMAVLGLNVGSWLPNWDFNIGATFGPQWISPVGDYLYFQYELRNLGYQWARVKANDFTTHNMGGTTLGPPMYADQYYVDGTFLYMLDPEFFGVYEDTVAGVNNDFIDLTPNPIVGITRSTANGLLYCVCGNTTLVRIDNFGGGASTNLNLGAVAGLSVPADPVRIKCLSDGKLYIPCMGANGVIVWDTGPETGIFKSGFANPVDVVETPTKKFAVQNAAVGLREIT